MPVRVATNVRPMKLIDLAGLIKMSATNSFRSMTAAVLLFHRKSQQSQIYLCWIEPLLGMVQ